MSMWLRRRRRRRRSNPYFRRSSLPPGHPSHLPLLSPPSRPPSHQSSLLWYQATRRGGGAGGTKRRRRAFKSLPLPSFFRATGAPFLLLMRPGAARFRASNSVEGEEARIKSGMLFIQLGPVWSGHSFVLRNKIPPQRYAKSIAIKEDFCLNFMVKRFFLF